MHFCSQSGRWFQSFQALSTRTSSRRDPIRLGQIKKGKVEDLYEMTVVFDFAIERHSCEGRNLSVKEDLDEG